MLGGKDRPARCSEIQSARPCVVFGHGCPLKARRRHAGHVRRRPAVCSYDLDLLVPHASGPAGTPRPRRAMEHCVFSARNGHNAGEEADHLHPPRLPLPLVIRLVLAPWRSSRPTSTRAHTDPRGRELRASGRRR